MFTRQQRETMATEIIDAMRVQYAAEGEVGDFADGRRYLAEDASDEELQYEHSKWVK